MKSYVICLRGKNNDLIKLIEKHKDISFLSAMAVPVATVPKSSIADTIIRACSPIVDLLQGLAYPACYIMCGAGIILIICGNRSKGITVLKYASIGYVLMQFLPGGMKILKNIGNSIGM